MEPSPVALLNAPVPPVIVNGSVSLDRLGFFVGRYLSAVVENQIVSPSCGNALLSEGEVVR
jgi:hypothetical protein